MSEKKLNVKVLKSFTDKHTGHKHKKDDVIKNITEERYKEILTKGKLVEVVVETEKK